MKEDIEKIDKNNEKNHKTLNKKMDRNQEVFKQMREQMGSNNETLKLQLEEYHEEIKQRKMCIRDRIMNDPLR